MRLCCRVLRSFTPVMRLCCRVLRSFTPVFFPCQEKRSGLRYASFLFRVVGIASCKFSCLLRVIGLCWFTSGLRVSLWRFRRGTEERGGTEGRGATESAARLSTLLREPIGSAMLSAGSTLGLRAPDCAKESNVEAALRPLFTLRRGLLAGSRCAVTRVDGKT